MNAFTRVLLELWSGAQRGKEADRSQSDWLGAIFFLRTRHGSGTFLLLSDTRCFLIMFW
jgi:hypothetical protein